jgi:hypothetical protein
MRPAEFTDPRNYTLSDTEEAAIFRAIETCSRAYAHGEPRLKKKQRTKKPTPTSMVSV